MWKPAAAAAAGTLAAVIAAELVVAATVQKGFSLAAPVRALASKVLRALADTPATGDDEDAGGDAPPDRSTGVARGLEDLIGNTPLLRIGSLSDETGCEILGKCEFLNPGGSVREALRSGQLAPGGLVTEGTVGSTGVSLATIAPALGVECHVCIPDDAAVEKARTLAALGARLERLRPVSISHPDHFVNVARRRAAERGNAVFADQFENLANLRAHERTGAEIWRQTGGRVDAFVSGAGTGGTLAGVSRDLKRRDPRVRCVLADPPGSGLYNKVVRGVLYTGVEAEGRRLRNPFDTVTEGVGLNRLTANFAAATLDGAVRVTDREAVEMSRYLMRNDGLFLGSSAAVNCAGAVKVARQLGPGHVVVTVLCDGGARHLSKFHCPDYLASLGLTPAEEGRSLGWVGAPDVDNRTAYGAESRALPA